MLPTDPQARKEMPITSGVLDYFPDALAAVANVSFVGNQQHNPGEPMHWAREKSSDHADCIGRHLLERGTMDDDGLTHSAKLAWRALALLQLEIEADALDNAADIVAEDIWLDQVVGGITLDETIRSHPDFLTGSNRAGENFPPILGIKGGPATMDGEIAVDIDKDGNVTPKPTFNGIPIEMVPQLTDENVTITRITTSTPVAYLCGPMTGIAYLNFPAFDAGQFSLENVGYDVISPANMDRESGKQPTETDNPGPDYDELTEILKRDIGSILTLDPRRGDAIACLPYWENSTGAVAEVLFARWRGLKIIDVGGNPIDPRLVDFETLSTRLFAYMKESLK